jgi:hypothetical protein
MNARLIRLPPEIARSQRRSDQVVKKGARGPRARDANATAASSIRRHNERDDPARSLHGENAASTDGSSGSPGPSFFDAPDTVVNAY